MLVFTASLQTNVGTGRPKGRTYHNYGVDLHLHSLIWKDEILFSQVPAHLFNSEIVESVKNSVRIMELEAYQFVCILITRH